MRQQVLKALANPARIFFVPYSLAVLNFVVQFIVFVVFFMGSLVINGIADGTFNSNVNPLWFLISVIGVHLILMVWSRREPQLAQIVAAKIRLLRHKVPKELEG